MVMQAFVQMAIVTYGVLSSGVGITFDVHTGLAIHPVNETTAVDYRQYAYAYCGGDILLVKKQVAPKVEEKIVLRERTLSEKCGLDLEKVACPDEEIVSLLAEARCFTSALGIPKRGAKTSWETPSLPKGSDWQQFSVRWDDDGGFYFGGNYFRNEDLTSRPWCIGLDRSIEFDR